MLALVDIASDLVPPDAILSHTWGDEEITIQQSARLGGCSPQTLASLQTLDKKRRATVLKRATSRSPALLGWLLVAGSTTFG